MSFGRKARSGPIGAFGAACASRGEDKRRLGSAIGSVPMLGSLAMAIGYSVVMGWIYKYLAGSITGAALSYGSDIHDVSGYEAAFGSTASAFGQLNIQEESLGTIGMFELSTVLYYVLKNGTTFFIDGRHDLSR